MKALRFRNLKLPQVSLVSSETRQCSFWNSGPAVISPWAALGLQASSGVGGGRGGALEGPPSPGWGTPKGSRLTVCLFTFVCLAPPGPSGGTRGLQASVQHVGAGSPTRGQPRPPALRAQCQPPAHRQVPSRFIVFLGGLGPGGRTGNKGKVRSRRAGLFSLSTSELKGRAVRWGLSLAV